MHYSNFCPKIGCHGNAPLSLVYGSVTDEFPGGTNPISKPNCMDMSLTNEVMAIFVILWPILAKIWLQSQRPLDSCNQKCLLWIGRPRKPPVIAFSLSLVEMHLCAFVAISVPKLVAMVMPLCSLYTRYRSLGYRDIEALEKVQKRATTIIPALKNLPYCERLKTCKLPTLPYGRIRSVSYTHLTLPTIYSV